MRWKKEGPRGEEISPSDLSTGSGFRRDRRREWRNPGSEELKLEVKSPVVEGRRRQYKT